MGKPMIMGRTTWESIGRALPGRQSIVLTRQEGFLAEGCDVVGTIDAALAIAGDAAEVMIIGGGNLYQQLLARTDRMYFTRVHARIDGDTLFPDFDEREWRQSAEEVFAASAEREYAFDILTLDRVT